MPFVPQSRDYGGAKGAVNIIIFGEIRLRAGMLLRLTQPFVR